MGERYTIMLDVAGPPEGGEFGTPPIVVDDNYDCPECDDVHLLEECPKCKSNDIAYGYGLGCGPGMGPYKLCNEEDCDWTWKQAELASAPLLLKRILPAARSLNLKRNWVSGPAIRYQLSCKTAGFHLKTSWGPRL